MKLVVRFVEKETMTVSESVLSKNIRIIPDMSVSLTHEDIRTLSDKSLAVFGKKLANKKKALATKVAL